MSNSSTETANLETQIANLQTELNVLRGMLEQPGIEQFEISMRTEAAHQTIRWGEAHDARKSPTEWAGVIVVLAGKAVQAMWTGDRTKALHHIITVAAVCANWHRHAKKQFEAQTGRG